MAETLIESDLACEACGYNLRALPLAHCCPECGEPVMRTFESAALKWRESSADFNATKTVADAIGSTIDAVLFVKDAILEAVLERRSQVDTNEVPELNAPEICRAIARYAGHYFNDQQEAVDLLSEWKLHRSEDVGRIVFALISAHQLNGTANERLEDFEGLFTLERLFEQVQRDCPRMGKNEHE